jgi:lipopolysaccharide/colanic/teichoic acid biosynthesis glycosyltransferase
LESFESLNNIAASDRGTRRAIDAVVAALALLASAPLVIIAAVAIVVEDRGPVFFSQHRVGRGGIPFRIFKLRSMTVCNTGPSISASDDARITRIGKILRRHKIDELPQLWNVFKGDMSLIGPRPEVRGFVDLNDARWREVLSVRPGITDAATVLFSDEESLLAGVTDRESYYRSVILPVKLDMNIDYLRARSTWTDFKLLVRTIRVVVIPALNSSSASRRASL